MAQIIWFERKIIFLLFVLVIFTLLNISLYQGLKTQDKDKDQSNREIGINNDSRDVNDHRPVIRNFNLGPEYSLKSHQTVKKPDNKKHDPDLNTSTSYIYERTTLPGLPGLSGCIIPDLHFTFDSPQPHAQKTRSQGQGQGQIQDDEQPLSSPSPSELSNTNDVEKEARNLNQKQTEVVEPGAEPVCVQSSEKTDKPKVERFILDSEWNLIRNTVYKEDQDKIKMTTSNDSTKNEMNGTDSDPNRNFRKKNVCYYRTFEKPKTLQHQSGSGSFKYNDKRSVRYGPMVKIVQDKTPISKDVEFIETFCHSNGWSPKRDYENYWTRLVLKSEIDQKLARIQRTLRGDPNHKPINILIIGMASLSRFDFIRYMPLSHNYLMNTLKATKFPGFNTLETGRTGSDNMAANLIPMLSGMSLAEFKSKWPAVETNQEAKTAESDSTNSDNAPLSSLNSLNAILQEAKKNINSSLIWAHMAARGYRTSFSEDFIKSAGCNKNNVRRAKSGQHLKVKLRSTILPSASAIISKFFSRKPRDHSISSKTFPRILHETIPSYLLDKSPVHYDFTVKANQLSRFLWDKHQRQDCRCKNRTSKKTNKNGTDDDEELAGDLVDPEMTSTTIQPSTKSKKEKKVQQKKGPCWGDKLAFQVLMENLVETVTTFEFNKTGDRDLPFWHMTWSSSLTRIESPSNARYGDRILYETLKKLKEEKRLENTALFLISDRGAQRFVKDSANSSESAKNRRKAAFLEARLPMLYVVLPERIFGKSKGFEQALKQFQQNSEKRMVTPFDLYPTFFDLMDLDRISRRPILQRELVALQQIQLIQQKKKQEKLKKVFKIERAASLFSAIPKPRSCADVGIKSVFCTCANLKRVDVNLNPNEIQSSSPLSSTETAELSDYPEKVMTPTPTATLTLTMADPTLISKIPEKVVQWINAEIKPHLKCHQLRLKRVNQAQFLQSVTNYKKPWVRSSILKKNQVDPPPRQNEVSTKSLEENPTQAQNIPENTAGVFELEIETSPGGIFYASVFYGEKMVNSSIDHDLNIDRDPPIDSGGSPQIFVLDVIRLEQVTNRKRSVEKDIKTRASKDKDDDNLPKGQVHRSGQDEVNDDDLSIASEHGENHNNGYCISSLSVQHLCIC